MSDAPFMIRQAVARDAPRLTEIAFSAKRHWGYPEHWIQIWREELTITADLIERIPMVVAEADGVIAGFCAIAGEGSQQEIAHLWVEPVWIGQGLGKTLLQRGVAMARTRGAHSLIILSDPNAVGFYVKMGAVKLRDVPSSIPDRTLPECLLNIAPAPVSMDGPFQIKNPAYREAVVRLFQNAGFIRDQGIRLIDCGPGWCDAELIVRDTHLQQDGFIHAAVQAAIADHAAGAAACTLIGPDEYVLSVEFKINLLRPAKADRIRCKARVLKPGRNLTVVEAEIYQDRDAQPTLTSKAMLTMAVLKKSD